MNLVTFIDGVQMFFRNFGLRHVSAVFGDFGMELAGPKAGRIIIALFARPVEWLRSRQVPGKSINPQIQKARQVCLRRSVSGNCHLSET
jgi:hypothetical protein